MREWRRIGAGIIILLCVLATTNTIALGDEYKNHKYKWAVSFSIEENLRVGPYDGYGISATRIFSENSSLRLTQSLNLTDKDRDTREFFEFSETTSLIFLRRLNPKKRAQCYWGVGPTGRYYYSENTDTYQSQKVTLTRKEWSLGILGLLGVEVFATDYIGFHAEYRSLFSIGRMYDSRLDDIESLDLNIGTIFEFGMSIYF